MTIKKQVTSTEVGPVELETTNRVRVNMDSKRTDVNIPTKYIYAFVTFVIYSLGRDGIAFFQRDTVASTAATTVGRNDEDNKRIMEKLTTIVEIRKDVTDTKDSIKEIKESINHLNERIDNIIKK